MELCSVFGKCGGCEFLDIEYDEQLKNKEKKVFEIFKNLNLKPKNYHGIVKSPNTYEYRNKMEYTFGNESKDAPLNLGMKAKGRKFDVHYTKDCKLVDDDFNQIVIFTRQFFLEREYTFRNYRAHKGYLRHLSVRKGLNTNELLINIATDQTDENDKDIKLWAEGVLNLKLKSKIVSILHSKTGAKGNVLKADKLEIIYGKDYYIEKILDLKFKIGPFSFFQTNTYGAEKLYETAIQYAENTDITYDLYSGTGTIASLLSKKSKKVYAVEIIKEAVEMAKENAELNDIFNVEFICGDVKEEITKLEGHPDFVVLDPPRAGLNPKVLKFLKEQKFRKIIYVSCNPETLAENIKEVEDLYDFQHYHLVDMFPNTRHIESVAVLEIK